MDKVPTPYICENPTCNAELSMNDIVYPPTSKNDVMHCVYCLDSTTAVNYFEE